MKSILIIQTAFIGDVILATPVIEAIHNQYPSAKISILIKYGCHTLFDNHPYIYNVYRFHKKGNKINNLYRLIKKIRRYEFDYVVNLHRFFSSGLITLCARSRNKIGFDKNPLSFFYTTKIAHQISDRSNPIHEIDRNLSLVKNIVPIENTVIKLYPSIYDFKQTQQYKSKPYICIAPSSIWFTKQFPKQKWIDFVNKIDQKFNIFFVGAKSDIEYCKSIIDNIQNTNIRNLAGKLQLLETAALFKDAHMVYVNDSAPLHLASAVNANVTAIFCSTTPAFGFGPLSNKHFIIESKKELPCKPCGLHGLKKCPKKHFNCANTIESSQLLEPLNY